MDQAVCNAVWAVMESASTVTLQEIELLGEVDPGEALKYLGLLMSFDYVAFAGCKRQEGGAYEVSWRQKRHTGDYAPYMDETGRFVDPNQPAGAEVAHKRERRPRRISLPVRMQVAAERLGFFTRTELMAAIFGRMPSHMERNWFTAAWGEMMLRRQFITSQDGRFSVASDVDPVVDSIRRILKASAGETMSRERVTRELGFAPSGPHMRHALNLLRAEGFQVTRDGYGKRSVFSVESMNSANDNSPRE
jgi:hypothetical protein